MRGPRLVAVSVLLALVAWACGSDGGDGNQVVSGDEQVIAAPYQWSPIPPGPLDGWEPLAVITGGPGSSSLYILGSRRVFGEHGEEYETREGFHAYDTAVGEWRELPSPPVNDELILAEGVATESSIYAILRDCPPGPPVTSVGPATCGDRSNSWRGLRFDLEAEEWSRWPLPVSMTDHPSNIVPTIVPGAYPPGSTLFFTQDRLAPPTENRGIVHAYSPSDDDWNTIEVNYAGVCSDGNRLYGFEGPSTASALEALAATFDPSAGRNPTVHEIDLPWIEADPTGVRSTEDVTVSYEDHIVDPGSAAYRIRPSCTVDGALITSAPLGRRPHTLPWQLKPKDAPRGTTMRPASLPPGFSWVPHAMTQGGSSRWVIVAGAWQGDTDDEPDEQPIVQVDPVSGDVRDLLSPSRPGRYDLIGDSVLVQLIDRPVSDRSPILMLSLEA